MALGDVAFGDAWRVLRREILVGIIIGLIMAAAMFVRAETMHVPFPISSVVSMAAVFIVVWATAVAAVLLLLLRRLGVDPAAVWVAAGTATARKRKSARIIGVGLPSTRATQPG